MSSLRDDMDTSVWGPPGPWDGPAIPLRDVFSTWAARTPDKTAIVYEGRRYSYAEMSTLVSRATAAFQSHGLEPGERCAIATANSPELVVSFYALAAAGCVTAWVNPAYRGHELLFPLSNTGARILLTDGPGELLDQVLESKAAGALPALEVIILRDPGATPDGSSERQVRDLRLTTWQTFTEAADPIAARPYEAADGDYAMIIHTSGATGVPKGAPSTHWQCAHEGYHYARALRTTADDVILAALPMFHSYGFICLLCQPFQLGATLVIMPEWNVAKALKLIEDEKVTVHPMAPTHYLLEMRAPEFPMADLSSLRAGLISGYVPPEELFYTIERNFPGMVFMNFWGSSETGPGLLSPFEAPAQKRYLTVGRPVVGEEVRIVDPDSGKVAPTGEPGELQLRGPNVIDAYWNDPVETARHIEKDGWFHTGDLATLDQDGFVTIVGRLKDQINRGGFKITPHDLEVEIARFPGVAQVCVLGVPNPVLGESTCACVIPEEGATLDLDELRDYMATRVARHQLPDELCVLEEFPRLSGGVKIDKYGASGLRAVVLAREDRQIYRKKSADTK